MKLKELFEKADRKQVWHYLRTLTPEAGEIIKEEDVSYVIDMHVIPAPLVDTKLKLDFNDKLGAVIIGALDEFGAIYSYIFSPWGEWLNLDVPEEITEKYDKDDIVARCFWEMTTMGWSPNEIDAKKQELINGNQQEQEEKVEEVL